MNISEDMESNIFVQLLDNFKVEYIFTHLLYKFKADLRRGE